MTITMVWGDKMKITIDNEEVLCDKNFTIEEEMLNTSSVILNNVYPATWEQDKDYTSRFYYPKDYSKCKIFNEIVHPTTREDVEGTSFSINVDTTKQYQVQTLKGQTTQNGTPTPSSPIPINITTGRQVVSVVGKNLLDISAITDITGLTRNGDKITLNGTFSSTSWTLSNKITLLANTTYTLSLNNYLNDQSCTDRIILRNGSTNITQIYFRGGNVSYTPTQDTIIDTIRFYTNGYSFSNYTFSIQLEEGNQPSTYEEYKGNDYEINLGKNLANIENIQIGKSWSNVANNNRATILFIPVIAGQQYSLVYSYTNENIIQIRGVLNKGANDQVSSLVVNGTFTVASGWSYISIEVIANTTFTSSMLDGVKIMLCKGSATINDYTPYKTPIYLGKIGTYQDYIFRNTTENPLYDSNLEEGQWYIHKEIGRYDFTGNENWTSLAQGTNSWYVSNLIDVMFIDTTKTIMSNLFYGIPNSQRGSTSYTNKIYVDQWKNTIIRDTTLTTKAQVQSATSGTPLYYVLNTPTNTLIEDEELINQLNAIELLEGLNNVSITSPYLPFIMSLMYNYQEGYTEEDMLFCGVVENTGNISLNPRHPHYCNLQVLDFKTFLSEGETLDFVIYEKTILEAINQVIGTISDYGFVLGNVNILHSEDVIGAYSTKDKTAYDVFNYIADITQSRWTTRMVDENTVAIDFYDPSLMPQGTAIDYTQEWFCDNNIIDMSFSYSSRDYRNKQVMLSGEVYANIETTEIIVADGYQTQFNTTGKIGYVSSLLLNGNPATIITKEEYDLGYEGDFVYQPGNTYFESVNLVSTGAIITIVYFAIIEGREVVLNQEEISRVSEMIDRKGVIARYENRNDATTTQELQAIGQSYLKYKGNPEVLLKVETLDNIWNIGERVEFDSPLEELTTEYMVKKKTINYITTQDNIFYTYELSSSFNSETEINYFDNQRSKMMGNIGAGEYISRNIDIENTANVIFYDLEVNEVVIDGDSTLQSELQTPLGVE